MRIKQKLSLKISHNFYDTEGSGHTNNNNSNLPSKGHIQVSPQMIRVAIKRLQLHKLYVNINSISEYLRRNYPIDNNKKAFREELIKKLKCAVYVGLIVMHGEDAYCLPNIREEANTLKAAFTAFWEIYKNYKRLPTLRYGNQNKKQSAFKRKLRYKIHYLEK